MKAQNHFPAVAAGMKAWGLRGLRLAALDGLLRGQGQLVDGGAVRVLPVAEPVGAVGIL